MSGQGTHSAQISINQDECNIYNNAYIKSKVKVKNRFLAKTEHKVEMDKISFTI